MGRMAKNFHIGAAEDYGDSTTHNVTFGPVRFGALPGVLRRCLGRCLVRCLIRCLMPC